MSGTETFEELHEEQFDFLSGIRVKTLNCNMLLYSVIIPGPIKQPGRSNNSTLLSVSDPADLIMMSPTCPSDPVTCVSHNHKPWKLGGRGQEFMVNLIQSGYVHVSTYGATSNALGSSLESQLPCVPDVLKEQSMRWH